MKARSHFAIITTTLAALSLSALASADMKYAGDGGLEFKLPGGTAGLVIEGKSSEVTASDAGGKITVTAKLLCGDGGCIKTGIDKRDEHLLKYLGAKEAKKNETCTFVVDKSKLKLPADGATSEGDVTGDMTVHGVTHSETIHYGSKRTGSDYHVHGKASFPLSDFGIEKPSFAGVSTGTQVEIKVKFKLRE